MRVFELAKKAGLSSKDFMAVLIKMNIRVKSHMSALTEDDVKAVLKKENLIKGKMPSKKRLFKPGTPEPAPETPPKKRFVLRKRRPSPAVESVATEEPDQVLSDQAESAQTQEALQEALVEAPGVQENAIPEIPLEEETVTDIEQKESIVMTPPPLTIETEEKSLPEKSLEIEQEVPPPKKAEVIPAEQKPVPEVDKKKGKIPLVVDEKGAFTAKQKEKPKRGRQLARDLARAGGLLEGQVDARKWEDFKPLHRREDHKRRDDRKATRKGHGPVVDTAKPRRKVIKIYEGLTVKSFSELIGQKVSGIVAKLAELGKTSTMNELIDLDEASLIADAFDVQTELVAKKTKEEMLMQTVSDDLASLQPRPPVITIMGHVDHGKTSLLDAIRQTNVTQKEAGGITQHIGAYMVETAEKKITFLDTPGHEAFTAMRARGANVTDIVILVVAADDGVMPQTIEAINHAKIAGVPIIVAVNKMDRPNANPDRVKQALAEHELVPEEWGGKTLFVEVSAVKNSGIQHLLETIDLQAEILELKADPKKTMVGTIIEARIEKGRGPVATVLVSEGTLKVGTAFVTGTIFGKVRALINDKGQKIKEAVPAMPVEVIGLNGVPEAGDTFLAVKDERLAKEVANKRFQDQRTSKLTRVNRVTLDELYQEMEKGEQKDLNVIVKADVQGSVQALRESLEKLTTDAVKLRVLHGGVGNITESDVLLADASHAIIVGFNVRSEPKARGLAEKEKVDLRFYSIIYEVIAEVRSAMEGLLAPTLKERVLALVEVRQIFSVPKLGTIAGGYVREGVASRGCSGVRVLRDSVVIHEGKLASLRRFKDDVKKVQTGYECGIGVENFKDIQVGDMLELYTFDEIATKLESA